jgi:hypothetical protein
MNNAPAGKKASIPSDILLELTTCPEVTSGEIVPAILLLAMFSGIIDRTIKDGQDGNCLSWNPAQLFPLLSEFSRNQA